MHRLPCAKQDKTDVQFPIEQEPCPQIDTHILRRLTAGTWSKGLRNGLIRPYQKVPRLCISSKDTVLKLKCQL